MAFNFPLYLLPASGFDGPFYGLLFFFSFIVPSSDPDWIFSPLSSFLTTLPRRAPPGGIGFCDLSGFVFH